MGRFDAMGGAAPSLRMRLSLLVIAALLPMVLLVGVMAGIDYQTDRAIAAQRTQEVARGLALAVEGELGARIAALRTLAGSRSLAVGDLAAFRELAEAMQRREDPGGNILLLREDGQVLMDLVLPPGVPLPVREETTTLRRVFATGEPAVSDVFAPVPARPPRVAIDVPVHRPDGSVGLVLSMIPSPGAFHGAIRRQRPPASWTVAVFDRSGVIMARQPDPDRFVGVQAPPSFLPQLLGSDEGTGESTSLDGTKLLSAWSRPGPSGWSVGVGVPRTEFLAPLWQELGATCGCFALALLAALGLARLAASRIAAPVRALANLPLMERVMAKDIPSLGLREADTTATLLVTALRERRIAVAARAKREAEFREAQRVAHIGSWHWDAASDATSGSDELLRIFGLDPATQTMPGFREQWGSFFPPEIWQRINAAMQRALATGEGYALDVPALRSGEPIWVTTRGEVVQDAAGRVVGLRGTVQDITARKLAEAALLESRATLEAALAAMTDAVFISDTDGNFIHFNDAFATFHRFACKDECARTLAAYPAFLEVFLEGGDPVPLEQWAVSRALRGETAVGVVYRLRRKDTWESWVGSYNLAPIRDGQGRIVGSVVTARDITERLRADEALAELNRTLEERVRDEIAAREAVQERAKHAQHMQALGQIAAGVAHEFNNILQAVQGGLGLIEARAGDVASVRRFARIAAGAAGRGSVITGRLLSFAQRSSVRPERIDPVAMLDAIRDVLAHTLGSQVTVRLDLHPMLPAVVVDKAELETALVNLGTNARDAMPLGGALTLAAAVDTITTGWTCPVPLRPGRYVRLAVSDVGTGMDAATLARATDPFFTTKPIGTGTGLGLSMAKGFAEQSGGGLAIASTPGHGTTVTLWLPVAPEETREGRLPAAHGPRPTAPLTPRVLLVDDEEMLRETLAAGLEDSGFAVLVAQSGAEALALLEAGEAVDVLVTDLSMPGMDGMSLIRQARARWSALPALVLTGYLELGEPGHEGTGGPLTVLRKPIGAAELAARLEGVLGRTGRPQGT
ncbi:Histidine kinase [Rhodovastum atsumiense]|uniref:histidine kinase n=1 Tax=Rhodovastum atsumiense TaxID=504468 RepID=A0A5M6J004_9PROT|nr:response regulator [Rhodovastum atsumiense]KAA5613407.1 PAS domain-containing protein [Rhodovastum atsumiense]CAH2603129.1 Histidine kinase [Rhodovastum atsumiense]